jgi:hypothetical protein
MHIRFIQADVPTRRAEKLQALLDVVPRIFEPHGALHHLKNRVLGFWIGQEHIHNRPMQIPTDLDEIRLVRRILLGPSALFPIFEELPAIAVVPLVIVLNF